MRKSLLSYLVTILLFISCNEQNTSKTDVFSLIPHNSGVIIKTNSLNILKSNLQNHDFISLLKNTYLKKQFTNKLSFLKDLNFDETALVCISNEGRNSFEITIVTESNSTFKQSLNSSKFQITSSTYLNNTINQIKRDDHEVYQLSIDDKVIISTSKLLAENTLRHYKSPSVFTSEAFKKLYKTTDINAPFSFFVNIENANDLLTSMLPNSKRNTYQHLANWVAIDADIDGHDMQFNGVVTASDSVQLHFNILKGLEGHLLQSTKIAPATSTYVKAYAFNDFAVLHKNINQYLEKTGAPTGKSYHPIFEDIDEISQLQLDKNTAILIHSKDVFATNEAIASEKNEVKKFRDISIYEFSISDIFNKNTPTILPEIDINYYFKVNDSYIFSKEIAPLQDIISSFQNGNTIEKNDHFKNGIDHLSEETSFTFIANADQFKSILKDKVSTKRSKEINQLDLKEYPWIVFQLNYQDDFGYLNGIIKKKKGTVKTNVVAQTASITLDNKITSKLQLVTNHRTKQKEIVVQDENNILYLISNKGNILWKKQLESKIVGGIKQVDLYKNGRLQLIFNTPHKLHVLDRNGKVVDPFPISFEDEITQPIAVFDYDKSRNYRFLITQNNHLLMLDGGGKTVKGFEFTKASSNLIHAPKHVRSSGKDYIVFPTTDGILHILNRRGQQRIKVNKKIDFSENQIYFYRNKFVATDKKGLLHLVDKSGKTEVAKLGLQAQHSFTTTSKTLASLSDNTLTIKKKKVQLDYGLYSEPYIFYLNDKIYVSVTDVQAKKVYLFDSNAKLLPNFPVYGASAIAMDNIDNDENPEFVVQGEDDSILIYNMN
ncbi:hypothetical protein ABN763_14215 [Spongiivirga sp. MCCC 1A20706]|uniref:hypothetical protein n=1 Tax=Spongiivirga sp. MCCC 1A20706 TaxID=3160963 RepID=UPI003977AB4E